MLALPATASSLDPAPQPTASAGCPARLVPMYGDVPRMWRNLTAARPRATTAIANLGNGPGRKRVPEMAALFAKARAAGIRVVGYVYTSYGKRSLRTVKREVDRWERWYPVDGIFVDNLTSARTGNLSYYRRLSAHIKTWPANFIVMNGWATVEYMPLLDVIIPFEGPLATFKTFRMPVWAGSFDASRFANIVYGVRSANAMRSVFDAAAQRNLGMLYVTDRPGPHPYFKLPSYLGEQERYLRGSSRCGLDPGATLPPASRVSPR
jgi:hypothetical protein